MLVRLTNTLGRVAHIVLGMVTACGTNQKKSVDIPTKAMKTGLGFP
jgi:hypothetical protein